MAQVKKFLNGSVIKAQEGETTPAPQRTYGHLWVDGIDYGNSEDVYNAFANHARSQGLNQGEFYDQWLTALRNGQDVVFGNGNTVNLQPDDMTAKRAGKRSGWTKFWDDTFDTRRNHFSDAIATARGFTFTPKQVKKELEKPAEKKNFETPDLFLDYNDDPKKKGHKIWSATHQNNLAAIKRVADVIAGLSDPDNSEYTYNDALKNAYEYAKSHPTEGFEGEWTPQAFADALFARLQNPTWTGYKDPANNADLDWLEAFGIKLNGAPAAKASAGVVSGGSTPASGGDNGGNTNIIALPDGRRARLGDDGKWIYLEDTENPEADPNNPEDESEENLEFGDVIVRVPTFFNSDRTAKISAARVGGFRIGSGTENYIDENGNLITDKAIGPDAMFTPTDDTNPYYVLYKLPDGGYMLLGQDGVGNRITPEFAEQLSKGTVAYKDITKNLQPLVYKAAAKNKAGGKIDFNKINAFAKGGKVIKAELGSSGLSVLDEALLNTIKASKNGLFTTSNIYQSKVNNDPLSTSHWYGTHIDPFNPTGTTKSAQLVSAYNDRFGNPTVNFDSQITAQPIQSNSNDLNRNYGDPNYDSSPAWTSFIKSGLSALDYGSMAWGRHKVHNQIEKGLKDSLYKRTTPLLQGLTTATPIEDAGVNRYDQYVQRGLTTPFTSDNVANTQNVLTLQANALQGRDQAVRQQSAAALQRQMQNQQIANQQAQIDAEAENDFRARLSGLKMNLAQNDASLTAQTAQSIQNLAREWRTKFDEQTAKYNQLQYNAAVSGQTELSDNAWKNYLRTNQSDAWNAWNNMSATDRNKYGNDINTWIQQSDYWNDALENEYLSNRKKLNQNILGAYKDYNLSPELSWLYRNRYGVPIKKSGGTLTVKQRNRYKNEPSEDIWINQNKATHKLVAKLNDNVIKTFLKTLK